MIVSGTASACESDRCSVPDSRNIATIPDAASANPRVTQPSGERSRRARGSTIGGVGRGSVTAVPTEVLLAPIGGAGVAVAMAV